MTNGCVCNKLHAKPPTMRKGRGKQKEGRCWKERLLLAQPLPGRQVCLQFKLSAGKGQGTGMATCLTISVWEISGRGREGKRQLSPGKSRQEKQEMSELSWESFLFYELRADMRCLGESERERVHRMSRSRMTTSPVQTAARQNVIHNRQVPKIKRHNKQQK